MECPRSAYRSWLHRHEMVAFGRRCGPLKRYVYGRNIRRIPTRAFGVCGLWWLSWQGVFPDLPLETCLVKPSKDLDDAWIWIEWHRRSRPLLQISIDRLGQGHPLSDRPSFDQTADPRQAKDGEQRARDGLHLADRSQRVVRLATRYPATTAVWPVPVGQHFDATVRSSGKLSPTDPLLRWQRSSFCRG